MYECSFSDWNAFLHLCEYENFIFKGYNTQAAHDICYIVWSSVNFQDNDTPVAPFTNMV